MASQKTGIKKAGLKPGFFSCDFFCSLKHSDNRNDAFCDQSEAFGQAGTVNDFNDFLLIPRSPIKPEINNQIAAGTGTGVCTSNAAI